MARTAITKNSSDDDDPPKLKAFNCAKLSLLLGILHNMCNEILEGDSALQGNCSLRELLWLQHCHLLDI